MFNALNSIDAYNFKDSYSSNFDDVRKTAAKIEEVKERFSISDEAMEAFMEVFNGAMDDVSLASYDRGKEAARSDFFSY